MNRWTQEHGATEADRDAQLEQMRAEMTRVIYELLERVRAQPDAISVTQAVAAYVDAWSVSALEMIKAAAMAAFAGSAAVDAGTPAPASSSASIDALHGAIVNSLACIVAMARAGQSGVDDACRRFADCYTSCFGDAIAEISLRSMAAFEQRLGVDPGLPN